MADGAGETTAVETMLTLTELQARLESRPLTPGELVRGRIVAIGPAEVTLDVAGTRGTAPREEFVEAPSPGSEVEVYVDEADGTTVRFSRHKAIRLGLWGWLESLRESGEVVSVEVISESRGDLAVDLGGVKAILPLRELAPGRRRDPVALLGTRVDVRVTHIREKKSQIVVSERAPIVADRAEVKAQTLSTIEKGQIVEGEVRRLTRFGAFVDIGGIDGLLHVNDMSWRRINHPSEVVEVGDAVTVKVLDYDPAGEKIALGLKQTVPDPWLTAEQRYRPGTAVQGEVVGLTEFGAFIMLPDGLEGLVHVSEMAWGRQVKRPRDVVAKGDAVSGWVLRVDIEKRRLGLTLRDPAHNPWNAVAERLPTGTRLETTVARVADFGIFVHLDAANDIAGLVHQSDFSWGPTTAPPKALFKAGDAIEVMVLDIDAERGRAALGIKQLHEDLTAELIRKYEAGQTLEGRVTSVQDFGAFVELEPGIEGLVPTGKLRAGRVEHASDVVQAGQPVVVRVVSVDREERKIGLSMVGIAQPGAEGGEASGEGGEPSAEAGEPGAEAIEPSAEAIEPSAGAIEPSAEASEPSAEASEPSAEAIEPSAEAIEPSAEAIEPSTAAADARPDDDDISRPTDELPATQELPLADRDDREPGR